MPNCLLTQPPISTNQPLIFFAHTSTQTNSANDQIVDNQIVNKKIDHFTKMMKDFVFLVWTLQNPTGPFTANNI